VRGARWAALAVLVAIGTGSVGCGSSSGPSGTNIAIITPGTRDDADWTTVTAAAVKKVAARFHVRAVVVDGGSGNVRAALERVAKHAQLIVVPYAGDRAVAMRVAAETKVPTLVWGDPHALREGQVADVEWAAVDGAYAAGTMAVHAAVYRSAGIVMCENAEPTEMATRYRMAAAFVAGARAQSKRVRLFYTRVGEGGGPVSDAQAKAATIRITLGGPMIKVPFENPDPSGPDYLAERGAEFIFPLCGPAAPGVMRGVIRADAEHQFVGTVGDKALINRENDLLTSILIHPELAIEQALRDFRAKRFGARNYRLEFANHGISLLRTGRTPGDAFEAAVHRRAQIIRKLVQLPDVSTEEALKAYMAEQPS
jgi:basic membrane lipoprotein Med (substrate-binding protein (PBP1-ABC) superfamily)